jgi:hypothetical protein
MLIKGASGVLGGSSTAFDFIPRQVNPRWYRTLIQLKEIGGETNWMHFWEGKAAIPHDPEFNAPKTTRKEPRPFPVVF